MIHSATITCPHCWQAIDIALDLSVDEQRQTEDCSVCCRPIVLRYLAAEGELVALDVEPENG